jgi:hypothetical protein
MSELIDECQQQAETIKQFKARVARIEKGLDYAGVKLIDHKDRRAYEFVDKILCEDGPQCVREVQAEAIEKAVREVRQQILADNEFGSVDACYTYKLINYAADIRQQADKG